MKDLIARLEAGSGEDRELDLAIIKVVFPTAVCLFYNLQMEDCEEGTYYCLTSFLDDCITLAEKVLPRFRDWEMQIADIGSAVYIDDQPHNAVYTGMHKDICRAFLIALLRAKEAGDELSK